MNYSAWDTSTWQREIGEEGRRDGNEKWAQLVFSNAQILQLYFTTTKDSKCFWLLKADTNGGFSSRVWSPPLISGGSVTITDRQSKYKTLHCSCTDSRIIHIISLRYLNWINEQHEGFFEGLLQSQVWFQNKFTIAKSSSLFNKLNGEPLEKDSKCLRCMLRKNPS